MADETGVAAGPNVGLGAVTAEGYRLHVVAFGEQLTHQIPTIYIREADVTDDDGDWGEVDLEGGAGGRGSLDVEPFVLEQDRQGVGQVLFVLDPQDALASSQPGARERDERSTLRRTVDDWDDDAAQVHQESRTLAAPGAMRGDTSTMELDNPLGDREPEAESALPRGALAAR